VPEGKAERIQAACKAEGMEFEYAFLMDALLEEQAQNITMDTTRVPFRTERRAFTIIDAPGHKEFLKNMITAPRCRRGHPDRRCTRSLREQTRRHGYLLSLLGLKQVVVVVNKMDLVNYDETVFERIRKELANFSANSGSRRRILCRSRRSTVKASCAKQSYAVVSRPRAAAGAGAVSRHAPIEARRCG